jgi:hypothetical protein
MVEQPRQSRPQRVLEYLGLTTAGDWAALLLTLALAVFVVALWLTWWSS